MMVKLLYSSCIISNIFYRIPSPKSESYAFSYTPEAIAAITNAFLSWTYSSRTIQVYKFDEVS